ncbi:Dihydrofolate reductase [Madurella mycetomatis]|uniref:Dihydrofolate reductase n=1 Tax=Madurella mycetomatis TaxID=100816 RepID=A0A175W9P4_9PEZI|nr:Dihydrofolate reductase [Madurella mycetomatis]KXX82364.1 Dihydrofolate reductase [Madurella mycetomatis]
MGDNRDTPQPPSRTDSLSVRTAANSKNTNTKAKKEVRILMLHGYTQSGPLFRAKTRALEKLLAKALGPLNMMPTLLYPTAPNRLSPRDIPGYEPSGGSSESGEVEVMDSWAWFRKDEASGTYRFVEEGMRRLAEAVTELRGGGSDDADRAEGDECFIDGVIGFSQGGCMAAMLASAMEGNHEPTAVGAAKEHEGWVNAVREANGGRPLKFAVIYSGFYAVPEDLRWLYEPKVRTPTLHFLGSLDTVVDESRSQGLVERCEEPIVMVHPGGHYVPVSKEWVMPLAGFIRKYLEGPTGEAN